MFKLFVCASLLIGLVGADYDFQDSDFNELLVDDLTDIDDDLLEPLRFKRGTDAVAEPVECRRKKGRKEKESHCCNGKKVNADEMKAVKEVKKACIAEVRGESGDDDSYNPLSCESVQAMRQQMVCAAECMAKKFDLIDGSGDMKGDTVLNHTRRVAGDNEWKAGVLEEYVDKCLAGLKVAKEVKQIDVPLKVACNPSPLEFHHCIWRKFVEGCPAESQIDSKKCKKIRERLAKGDTSAANKFFKQRSHHRHYEGKVNQHVRK